MGRKESNQIKKSWKTSKIWNCLLQIIGGALRINALARWEDVHSLVDYAISTNILWAVAHAFNQGLGLKSF